MASLNCQRMIGTMAQLVSRTHPPGGTVPRPSGTVLPRALRALRLSQFRAQSSDPRTSARLDAAKIQVVQNQQNISPMGETAPTPESVLRPVWPRRWQALFAPCCLYRTRVQVSHYANR